MKKNTIKNKSLFYILALLLIGTYYGYSQVDYATDPNLSPAVKAFLKPLNSGGKPLETMSKEDARNVLVGAQAAFPVDLSGITESEKTITYQGYTVTLNIVRPEGASGKLPVFMFTHGGGWILGDYPTHKRMVRDLVVLTGYVGVFVNYTRSPEAKYPQAVNEVYAVSQWLATHGDEINVDGTKLGIVGNSAGGNLASASALKISADGGTQYKAEVLMWPVTNANFENASWKQFGKQRFLTASLMKWMWDQYIPENKRKEVYASPLQATTAQLKNMPPTLIQVAENDILRDEGENYGRKLSDAGVDVTTVRYNDVIHDFGLLNGLANLPQTKALFVQAAATLKKYLK
ncbi:alpha/beta hydrolase [Flavobacterium sp. MR2016-29]|uniref:alpha/beta hydrolase n=1 Tax=Flavobacterium sp. MR2016-29 TaxID=2783795 RepID=UPI00188B5893|nr:alpha/beta hydrolase [Flavobacterium sp. MR2016-29]MBF4494514.1 alpha/beta hydrolase [Flavobacterium sp. MR2016-29]